MKILKENKEEYEDRVFSDYMNKIKNKKEKENIIVLLTYRSIYLINKSYVLIKKYSLKNL